MDVRKPPEFGKRGRAPPIIIHAPQGLGDRPPQPHSHWVRWTLAGIGALYAIIFAAVAFRQDCQHDDQAWSDGPQDQQNCRRSGGWHFGGGSGGGLHSTSSGGFGGSGEGGGHGGGGGE